MTHLQSMRSHQTPMNRILGEFLEKIHKICFNYIKYYTSLNYQQFLPHIYCFIASCLFCSISKLFLHKFPIQIKRLSMHSNYVLPNDDDQSNFIFPPTLFVIQLQFLFKHMLLHFEINLNHFKYGKYSRYRQSSSSSYQIIIIIYIFMAMLLVIK